MVATGAAKRRLMAMAKAWHEHYSPTWHGAAIVYSSTRVGRIAFTQLPGTIGTIKCGGTGRRKLTAGTDAD